MRLSAYLRSRSMIILLQILGLFFLVFFLYLTGNSKGTLEMICLAWLFGHGAFYGISYFWKKKYFDTVEDLLEHLEKRYLIGEVMPDSFGLEDQIYRRIIRRSNQSVMEAIDKLERQRQDYQEYMESWVHEIKAPLSAAHLICENQKNEVTRSILTELSQMDHDIETALFYAKSDQIENDYCIKEYDLREIILEAIERNRQCLIQNQMKVEMQIEPVSIFGDKKWLVFLLTQIMLNAVKYKKEGAGTIGFLTVKETDSILLSVKDDGIGIPKEDLPRIFEKGFTGKNGRTPVGMERASGIGLYLCKKLCKGMGMELYAASVQGEFTEMTLIFPKNSYITKL